ncbi:MAG: hypothetical protein CML06_01705 [Pseudomonadales bacterium]|nr:hypothetical protein [Pseudomonadales bacterium]
MVLHLWASGLGVANVIGCYCTGVGGDLGMGLDLGVKPGLTTDKRGDSWNKLRHLNPAVEAAEAFKARYKHVPVRSTAAVHGR